MRRAWTKEEEQILRDRWGTDITELAEVLGRTETATRARASLLGLIKRRFSA